MDNLLNNLKNLKDIQSRTLIGLLCEIDDAIQDAQDKGYNLVSIHKAIQETIPRLKLTVMKTTLSRIRKEKKDNKTVPSSSVKTKKSIPIKEKKKGIAKTAEEKTQRQQLANTLFNRNK